jgi:hypothetical protein
MTEAMKRGSRSDMICDGSLKWGSMYVAYSRAVPTASMVSLHGINMHAFEKVSVMVSIESYPCDIGSLTIKSIATEVKGRVNLSDGMRKGGGLGFVGLFLHDWHK